MLDEYDITVLGGQLRDQLEMESFETFEGDVWFQWQGSRILVLIPDSLRSHLGTPPRSSQNDAIDRALVFTVESVLDITQAHIQTHQLGEGFDVSSETEAVHVIEEILRGNTVSQSLDPEVTLQELRESGYPLEETPEQVAEILAGWAIKDPTDRILTISSGPGTLLREVLQQSEKNGSNAHEVVNVVDNPLAALLISNQLQDSAPVEFIDSDFITPESSQRQLPIGSEDDQHEDELLGKFDAIVANPPMGRLHGMTQEQRTAIREHYPENPRDLSSVYVLKAIKHLSKGGRAAFVLPRSVLRQGLLDHLAETCSICRVIELPPGTFPDVHSHFRAVIVTVVKEERLSDARDTGVGKFQGHTLPEDARGIFEQPIEGILDNRYDKYDAAVVRAAHDDLRGMDIMRILSAPAIVDVLRAEELSSLGDLEPDVEVRSGATTGDNEFFYFDAEERASSDIDDRFFRPLIKDLPDEGVTFTTDDVDQYVLYLGPYLEEAGISDSQTEERVVDQLLEDGHDVLADYLRSRESSPTPRGRPFTLSQTDRFVNPDLVLPQFFDTPRCYDVEVDDVIFDSTVVGIHTQSEELATAVHKLLNTPLYREFIEIFSNPIDFDWSRINIRDLRDVPVSPRFLTEDVADNLGVFLPPEDDNDVIGANQVLLEACERDETRRGFQRFMATREDFAWSWFLSLPEVEEFQEVFEEDPEKAREFVLERFDEELFDEARETFNRLEFFRDRRDLLNDLLMEFQEDHYRSFLAGITLQFEGVLTDLVYAVGGDVYDENSGTKFDLPGEDEKEKTLNELISRFFDGPFGSFLDHNIRERRNKIAHGDVIEDDRELATHFFITFYALCYGALAEYTRFSETPG